MSGSNGSGPPLPEITLAELERLIRLLGMLGSEHDGEVLAAARFAQRWVTENATDWRTLLTPPEEPLPVTGVGPPIDVDALAQAQEVERVEAFQRGFQAGTRHAMARVKAQAQALHAAGQPVGSLGAVWAGLGRGLGGAGAQPPPQQGPAPGGPQAAPGGVPWGTPGVGQHHQGNPWPPGSWKAVAWELLERDRQGIPGVFRGPPGASQEQQFVADVLRRGFATLTSAQEKWLRDIAGRNGLSW